MWQGIRGQAAQKSANSMGAAEGQGRRQSKILLEAVSSQRQQKQINVGIAS
jgi:hypothetical protein